LAAEGRRKHREHRRCKRATKPSAACAGFSVYRTSLWPKAKGFPRDAGNYPLFVKSQILSVSTEIVPDRVENAWNTESFLRFFLCRPQFRSENPLVFSCNQDLIFYSRFCLIFHVRNYI
jgi:hypothetical protein